MIRGSWNDPNFKFSATDAQGKKYEFFCYAASAAEVKEHLERKRLTVLSIEPYQFSEWKEKARKATDKAIWQRVKDRWSHFEKQARTQWAWLTENDTAAIAGLKKQLVEKIKAHDRCDVKEAVRQVDAWTVALVEEDPAPGMTVPKTPINGYQGGGTRTLSGRRARWPIAELIRRDTGQLALCQVTHFHLLHRANIPAQADGKPGTAGRHFFFAAA